MITCTQCCCPKGLNARWMAPTDQTGYLARRYQVVNRGIELNGADCRRARFVRAVLKGADLARAQFARAELSYADLTDTKFRGTRIATEALESTEWWKADFTQQPNLLKAVYKRDKQNLPDLETLYRKGEIHWSVLDFIGELKERPT